MPTPLEVIASDPHLKQPLSEAQVARITELQHEFDPHYLDKVCKNCGPLLKYFIAMPLFVDEDDAQHAIKDAQALHVCNHLSHFDYVQVVYDSWKFGVKVPRIAGKESVFTPRLEEIWRKCGAFKIPRNMGPGDAKLLMYLLRAVVASGDSLLIFPEGGRSYDGQLHEFKTGGISVMHTACRDFKKDILVVPHCISYDKVIEHDVFPWLAHLKETNIEGYQELDAATFKTRYKAGQEKWQGALCHVVGRPFSMLDFPSGIAVAKEAHSRVEALLARYAGMIDDINPNPRKP